MVKLVGQGLKNGTTVSKKKRDVWQFRVVSRAGLIGSGSGLKLTAISA